MSDGTRRTLALFSAEPSGDLQAAAVLTHLRELLGSGWDFVGVGGQHSRAAGLELWQDSSLWSVVGVSEALGRLPRLLRTYWDVRTALLRTRPELTVFIDAPAIHMRLAGVLQKAGLRTAYYFPPSAWSTNPKRLRQIHGRVSDVVCAFRFNAEQYARLGLPVAYFGHPLVDLCHVPSRSEALAALGLPDGEYVALLPGSRTQEIRTLLPVFLQVAAQLGERWQFLLPTATPQIEAMVRREVPPGQVHVVPGQARLVMSVCRAGLLASGSATLEAALVGLPHVLAYRLNDLDYFLARLLMRWGLMRIGSVGLPNLVLQERVVAEVLQGEVTAARLCAEIALLLEDGEPRTRALRDLARVREALGEPGAVERIATHLAQEACRVV